MSHNNEQWVPPVEFYFQVQFHWGTEHISVSFMEVSGLDQQLVFQEITQSGDDGMRIKLPKEVKHGNIVLKRPLEPTPEKINEWINQCFSYMLDGWIEPCMLAISLINADNDVIAYWTCTRAFPIKWSLGDLNAQKSGLAFETLTLTYNRLERKK